MEKSLGQEVGGFLKKIKMTHKKQTASLLSFQDTFKEASNLSTEELLTGS